MPSSFILYEDKPCRVEDIAMHELVRRIDQVIGDVRPDLVITHSANDLHWDHGLVNRATVSALRRTPCDLLAYLSSPEMNAQSRSIGNCFADITGFVETKLAAIACHKTPAPEARPRIVARPRARDGPDQRLRRRGGVRDAPRPGLTPHAPHTLPGRTRGPRWVRAGSMQARAATRSGPRDGAPRRGITRLRWPCRCTRRDTMKKLLLLVSFSLFTLSAAGCGNGDLGKLTKLKDEACACKDKACADAVNKKIDAAMQGMKEPSADEAKKYMDVMTEAGVCLAKAGASADK